MSNRLILSLLLLTAAVSVQPQVVPEGLSPHLLCCDTLPARAPMQPSEWVPERPVPVDYDSTRLYRQAVILVEFSDMAFSMPDPVTYYDRVFNEHGYNLGVGPGCMADYLLAQSGGRLHVQFDIFGPYRIDFSACGDKPRSGYTGIYEFRDAATLFFADHPDLDYSVYDWKGDGNLTTLLCLFAGPGGDEKSSAYIYPNTGIKPFMPTTPDGREVEYVSTSVERYMRNGGGIRGLGTVAHEFMHSLGLPDVYPTVQTNFFSVVDTWDLMDGGNWLNLGWCPPNLSAPEKMYLGWLQPTVLTRDTLITGMRPVADGGEAYMIMHTANEYLLLENRQQTGWDYAIPGHGLIIWHVDYRESLWVNNNVNSSRLRLNILPADNLSYNDWKARIDSASTYTLTPMMRSRCMSTAAYPWSTDSTAFVNDCLTDQSTPSMLMNNTNALGSRMLAAGITDIRMDDDGAISFAVHVDPVPIAVQQPTAPHAQQRKVIRNGTLYIISGNDTYTVTGLPLQR